MAHAMPSSLCPNEAPVKSSLALMANHKVRRKDFVAFLLQVRLIYTWPEPRTI